MPDFINDRLNGATFEASVRQVARQLYKNSRASGPINLEARERDEIIDTGTEIIIIEATKSRKMDKTKYDMEKSIDLINSMRKSHIYTDYNFRIILVTAEDPTADQTGYVKSIRTGCPKEIVSFTSLFSRLFDARHYIRVRGDHFFGSVRDPVDEDNYNIPASIYIPTALSDTKSGAAIKASNLAERMLGGGRYVLFGDYGSGKSMTLRDVYFRIRDKFIDGDTICCPIYLNLREHIAQTQPDEALYRHAERIGFPNPYSLISAWRAGFVMLFLDGFDELTPPQFASSIVNLRQARRFAVEIVRNFMQQTPRTAPIIIAGRESYFDSRDEAEFALGYGGNANIYDLAGFTDSDIEKFLKTKGGKIPSWLPTRPLLLGYLANAGLIKNQDDLLSLNPVDGWDNILSRVCDREVSQIWGVGFESSDLRLFIDRLATRARRSRDGRGLDDSALRATFRSVFGRDADEPANLLAMRLPGLGSVPGRSGAREFIDADFADAAAGGDLKRFIDGPFADCSHLKDAVSALGSLGREMALNGMADAAAKVAVALSHSGQDKQLATTSADLLSLLLDLQSEYKGVNVSIVDANFEKIVVDFEINFSSITLVRCIIDVVEINHSNISKNANIISKDSSNSPKFHDCMIGRLEGAVSAQDVPLGILTGTTSVERYAAYAETNDAVMSSSLPDPVKVLLTVLRKLFMQRGSGRQYGALRRGLPPKMTRFVQPIINLVKTNNYAGDVYLDRRTILIPNRSRSADALSIINGPNTSNDPLVVAVRGL